MRNVKTEGLEVTTQGNTLTITAGTISLPNDQATLETDQMFVFRPRRKDECPDWLRQIRQAVCGVEHAQARPADSQVDHLPAMNQGLR